MWCPPPPKPVSLKELHTLRKASEDVIGAGKNIDGSFNTDGFIGLQLKKTIDELIDAHPEGSNFQIGSSEYARYKKSQILTDALARAQRSALWQNGNEAAAIGNEVKNILNSKRYKHTFTKKQRADLERLTKRDLGALVGAFGSRTVSGAAFGAVLAQMMGISPLISWPIGNAVRTGRNASRIAKFKAIEEDIRRGE